jgi:hypothetical protein
MTSCTFLDRVAMCQKGIGKCHSVIFFDISEQDAKARRLAEGEGEESFHSIYETFKEQSLPVKEKFETLGECHIINAMQDPEAIFCALKVGVVEVEHTFT